MRIKKKMTLRKVDIMIMRVLADCIRSDQVPARRNCRNIYR